MHQCPKCSSTRITGPRYYRKAFAPVGAGESLTYTCENCGYTDHQPTHDQKRREPDPYRMVFGHTKQGTN